jgi:glutamyl/glutaminyl-tRNA synthetase
VKFGNTRAAQDTEVRSARPLRLRSYTGAVKGGTAYIGRLAPSPTGLLHLGHVRTFAVAHRRAREAGGALCLRMDDLDPQRSRPEFALAAEEDLGWLRLSWDGEPWLQSRRGGAYRAAWERLVLGGWVYPCGCSRRDLRTAVGAPHEGSDHAQDEVVYPGICRPLWLPGEAGKADERARWLAAGPDGSNWRFRVPDGVELTWEDGGFGSQSFTAGADFGDFSIWRRDGVPAYQLATVVDDADLGVTEVVRGADLLLSTARQLLLFRALGLREPKFYHCPLVLDAQGHRLAKRSDALSVRALRERGMTPYEVLAEPKN